MAHLNSQERLNLKKLIDESHCEDNTENIRSLKHSTLIRDDVRKLDTLKNTKKESLSENEFNELCQAECPFLFNNYTDIFNKMIKNELDLTIMTKLLTVLKLIEDNKVDQHEGSVMVGKILKELYIDSAIKRTENIDKQYDADKVAPVEAKTISWKEYRQTQK
uniref:Uncharacterized protein n=1 Tax=viral metagenome TaxID=1070528 RepID=A0A6C0JHX3_9ZZZZ